MLLGAVLPQVEEREVGVLQVAHSGMAAGRDQLPVAQTDGVVAMDHGRALMLERGIGQHGVEAVAVPNAWVFAGCIHPEHLCQGGEEVGEIDGGSTHGSRRHPTRPFDDERHAMAAFPGAELVAKQVAVHPMSGVPGVSGVELPKILKGFGIDPIDGRNELIPPPLSEADVGAAGARG